jgi:hypothetical protein
MNKISTIMLYGWMVPWVAMAGQLNPSSSPNNPDSAMYTVDALYQRLNSGVPGAKRGGGFADPTNAPGGTAYTLDEIMAKAPATNGNPASDSHVVVGKVYWGLAAGSWGTHTGTMYSTLVPKTGQTTSYQSSDDGDHKKGLAWPNPRFTEGTGISSNCVWDNLTGLIWLKCPNGYHGDWASASTYCEGLDGSNGRGGYTGWHLPSRSELQSLIDASKSNPALPAGHPFKEIQSADYWSSTPVASDGSAAWMVNLGVGRVDSGYKTYTCAVWPVLGTWPKPRFSVGAGVSSNCVVDNLTGITWMRSPNCAADWPNALGYCEGLDGTEGRGGYTDWRLPNRNELQSLLDLSSTNLALPAGHPFLGIQSGDYWSSTTCATNSDFAWMVNLGVGRVQTGYKLYTGTLFPVWPVRGGE